MAALSNFESQKILILLNHVSGNSEVNPLRTTTSMKNSIRNSLVWITATLSASCVTIANVAQASTALPMSISTGEGMFDLIVPDTNTTKSAYGGRLRVYDVHIAKMVEVTYFMCSSGRLSPGTVWSYRAGNGSIDMGNFQISCQLANDLAIAYGLGQPESTSIRFSYEEAGSSVGTMNIPILNITGGKVDKWMSFTQRFKPTR